MERVYYIVGHAHGGNEHWYDTLDDAIAAVREVYTDPVIGHSGDIADGGSRTLIWTREELAQGDDGSRACCTIRKHTKESL